MQHYCVWRDGAGNDSYWLLAASPEEARRFVARSVTDAHDAEDGSIYECRPDTGKTPPAGMIYRRLNGPVAIMEANRA